LAKIQTRVKIKVKGKVVPVP